MKMVCILIALFMIQQGISGQPGNETRKNKSFVAGEQLKYVIRYGFVHGGEAQSELKLVKYEDKTVYHAKVTAQTTGLAEKLFGVKDIYESYFDTRTNLPYKAIRNIREGNYKYYNEVYYNHEDSSLYSQRSDSVFRVAPDILDMVSTLYYIRSVNIAQLNKGDAIEVITFFGDEIFPFKIRYTGKEIIKSKFGKIECYRFDPVVEPGRIFKSEDDMTIWISADQNLIPVMVQFDMWVGSVKCELDGFSNLKHALKFNKN